MPFLIPSQSHTVKWKFKKKLQIDHFKVQCNLTAEKLLINSHVK